MTSQSSVNLPVTQRRLLIVAHLRYAHPDGDAVEDIHITAQRLGISAGELLGLAREAAEDASLVHCDRLTQETEQKLARDLSIIQISTLAQERVFA